MKRLLLLAIAMLFVGCNDTPTLYYSNDYKGEPIRITDTLYVKKVNIQGVYALLQCDRDGNIIQSQSNLNMGYQDGKVFKHISMLNSTDVSEETPKENFVFKCSDINDCYNQVIIVKNSILK